MTPDKVTLNEIMTAVRELTFDRFIIPAFAIKAMGSGYFITVDKSFVPILEEAQEEIPTDEIPTDEMPNDEDDTQELDNEGETEEPIKGKLSIIKVTEDAQTEETTEETIVELAFHSYPTMESIMDALIDLGIVVAYTPYFRGTESSLSLIPVARKELTEDFTAFRKYFFSNTEIEKLIEWYYWKVLDIPNVLLSDDIVGMLKRPSEKHLTLWVSYYLCEKRRLYESAAASIGQSFTDGSDYVGSNSTEGAGTVTTTQIGSVFSITEDPTKGFFYEDFNRIGSDNVLGDRYSFWYKLQVWLRQQLEEIFGDYSLRKNNVMPGYIELTRELDFRSYYDSYPFTLSPLSRGIVSKTP